MSITSHQATFKMTASVLWLMCLPVGGWAYPEGAPDGFTGAPGENTCQTCHSIGPDDGSMAIDGMQSGYIPGATHPITVSLEDPGQFQWGFQLTAVDAAGDPAGTFVITDATNTQLWTIPREVTTISNRRPPVPTTGPLTDR